MIRGVVSLLLCLTGLLSGCGDDVEIVKQTEEVHESAPQPVSPGEPIVE